MPLGRKLFKLAKTSPVATEILRRIPMLCAIEVEVRGSSAEQHHANRAERGRVIAEDLKFYPEARLRQVSAKSKLAEAMRHPLGRWNGPIHFLDDGRVDTNTVENSI